MMIVLVLMWWYAHRVRTRLSYLPAVYNMTGWLDVSEFPSLRVQRD